MVMLELFDDDLEDRMFYYRGGKAVGIGCDVAKGVD